ncbi:MAG: calcium-binding protein, partial [Pseudomonadota bacterium]
GSDVIQETASYNNNRTDTFVFTDLTADDVQFSRNGGGDLVMAVAGETITVIDHFVSSYERMEKVEFADGTVLDLAGIQTKVDDDALLV